MQASSFFNKNLTNADNDNSMNMSYLQTTCWEIFHNLENLWYSNESLRSCDIKLTRLNWKTTTYSTEIK